MVKEKKKSDWDDLQDLLSSSETANDWDAAASNDETAKPSVAQDVAAVPEEKTNNSNVETPAAKKATVKGKRTTSGEKKTKSVKSRKKTATKNVDAIATALEIATDTDKFQETETLDVAVGDADESTKKRRRSSSKKAEQSEGDLVENVLQLEKENKAKKRSRAKELDENPFVGLLSQIGQIADAETTEDAPKDTEVAQTAFSVEQTFVDKVAAKDDEFSFDNFFEDLNVEDLDISWGKPVRSENEPTSEPVMETAPKPNFEAKSQPAKSSVSTENDAEKENVRSERRPRRDDRDRRGNRRDRDRDSRRRREFDAEPVAVVEEKSHDEAPVAVDLNDLDAFFATPEIEIVGFAPVREKKDVAPRENNAEKASKKNERAERSERPKRFEQPTNESAFGDDQRRAAPQKPADGDESDERSRRRRRRRGNRRDDDASPRPFGEKIQNNDAENSVEFAVEQEREPEVRRERRHEEREERRERRPRRENDAANVVENNAETSEEGRVEAPQRVLPSWSDAISYVVRFNMSRRANRRKN